MASGLGLLGTATLIAGVAGLFGGRLAEGIVATYGGLLLLLGTAQGVLTRVVVRRRAVEGIRVSRVPEMGPVAVIIPYSRRFFWLVLGLPVLLLVGIVLVITWAIFDLLVAPDVGSVMVVVIGAICGGYLLGSVGEFLCGKIVCGYVALSPEGIFHRSWAFTSFVPWEQVVKIWPFEGGGPVITVQSTANADGWSYRTSRFWRQPESGFGLNLTVRGSYLSVDPALLYHAMRFYFNSPQARSELSGDAAVQRLTRADIPVPPSSAEEER